MNLISKLLPPSNIVLDLEVSSKKRMFEQAGLIFENNQGVARSLVFDSLFARERLGSTGLGQGVAIPHGRIKGLREAVAAFVRLGTPVPFDAASVSRSMRANRETHVLLTLAEGNASVRFWTSDLTVDYVKFNADYCT